MIEKYKEILKERLSEKRYHHSLCVADEAVRLAKLYGANEEKAYLAGLLHDICKNEKKTQLLENLAKYGIILSDVEKAHHKLWHAMAGAEYIRDVLEITDEEIITAVRYHTTARANMGLLEKVLYLADFTSADRDYNGVERMREKVEVSMAAAMKEALQFTICDLAGAGKPIHPDALGAYNEIILEEKMYG